MDGHDVADGQLDGLALHDLETLTDAVSPELGDEPSDGVTLAVILMLDDTDGEADELAVSLTEDEVDDVSDTEPELEGEVVV